MNLLKLAVKTGWAEMYKYSYTIHISLNGSNFIESPLQCFHIDLDNMNDLEAWFQEYFKLC
jgi:hypothetical protein